MNCSHVWNTYLNVYVWILLSDQCKPLKLLHRKNFAFRQHNILWNFCVSGQNLMIKMNWCSWFIRHISCFKHTTLTDLRFFHSLFHPSFHLSQIEKSKFNYQIRPCFNQSPLNFWARKSCSSLMHVLVVWANYEMKMHVLSILLGGWGVWFHSMPYCHVFHTKL